MKKLIVLFILFAEIFTAQETSSEDLTSAVENLFNTCKYKNFTAAAALIAYTGSEIDRNYTSPLNPKSAPEMDKAERIAKKIKAYLDISDSYEILSSSEVSSEGKDFLIATIGFKSGKQILEIDFKFVKVNNNLLLISIN